MFMDLFCNFLNYFNIDKYFPLQISTIIVCLCKTRGPQTKRLYCLVNKIVFSWCIGKRPELRKNIRFMFCHSLGIYPLALFLPGLYLKSDGIRPVIFTSVPVLSYSETTLKTRKENLNQRKVVKHYWSYKCSLGWSGLKVVTKFAGHTIDFLNKVVGYYNIQIPSQGTTPSAQKI